MSSVWLLEQQNQSAEVVQHTIVSFTFSFVYEEELLSPAVLWQVSCCLPRCFSFLLKLQLLETLGYIIFSIWHCIKKWKYLCKSQIIISIACFLFLFSSSLRVGSFTLNNFFLMAYLDGPVLPIVKIRWINSKFSLWASAGLQQLYVSSSCWKHKQGLVLFCWCTFFVGFVCLLLFSCLFFVFFPDASNQSH